MNSLQPTGRRSMHEFSDMPEADDDVIDIGRLVRVLLAYKWRILGFALALSLLATLFTLTRVPMYRATASTMLESQQANLVGVEDVYAVQASHMYLINTQFDILKSRELAERVVRRLNLHKHPVYAPKELAPDDAAKAGPTAKAWWRYALEAVAPWLFKDEVPKVELTEAEKTEKRIQGVANQVAGAVSVSPVEFSMVANISFESSNAVLAARVANAIAEEFIEADMEARLTGTVRATDWLSERLDELKSNLRRSEEALQDFRDLEGLVSVGGVTSLGNGDLSSLNQRLQEANKARIEAQNIINEVRRLGSQDVEDLMTLQAVLNHPLVKDLKREQAAAQRAAAELAKRYGAKHPKMIAAQTDLDAANVNLSVEVRKVVSGIEREYAVAQNNERELQSTLEASKTEVQEFNRKEFELQELQREVETNRELYDVFFTRIKSVSQTGGFEKPHARIVDPAVVPGAPFKPNVQRSAILALILGVMLGSGVAILLTSLDNTIKTPDDLQDKLGLPMLGSVPLMDTSKAGDFEQFWDRPNGPFAESFRTIRTGVVLSNLDNPSKIIVVTSSVPGEGKSTTALNLAAALGQMENTLLIGADLRRPSIAMRCGLKPNHPGLSHYVSATRSIEECIERVDAMGISVMPAGVIPTNPLEMLSSERFSMALRALSKKYDRIVIDSAPVLLVSDARILASYADSVIYVVRADSTSATQVKKGVQSIIASNEPLTGVVLNQFDAEKAEKYYYGQSHYKQYGDYYKSHEPEDTATA
ncbi:polysaccharide biosynthesis tyrosine autokinase [Congregibacter variabilis]|uniref:non-specific protein-tyrosine kinase n=1 Tax=Congregibacter variabilis TaxID=3081200 RepID=A0ABZ0I437_9GAMM|nr:polysaccharide biosynthesis tyrosine autokinase [Congregibacter sp. IMCC43200]